LFPFERESECRVVFPHLLLSTFVALYEQTLLLLVRVSFVVLIGRPVKSLPPVCSRTNQILLFAYLQFILLLLKQLSSLQFVYPEDKYRWL